MSVFGKTALDFAYTLDVKNALIKLKTFFFYREHSLSPLSYTVGGGGATKGGGASTEGVGAAQASSTFLATREGLVVEIEGTFSTALGLQK